MRNFIKKYIRSFKEAKSQQKPKTLKPSKKVINVFCEGKELISNQDLHDNTLKILYNILNPASAWWNRFANVIIKSILILILATLFVLRFLETLLMFWLIILQLKI